jgi:Zn-dependent peptidase ImmA (M78 family)
LHEPDTVPIDAAEPDRHYSPHSVLKQLGIRIIRTWLRDTWGLWLPDRHAVVVAEGISEVQERCTLAHEVEHILANDQGACGMKATGSEPERAEIEHGLDLRASRKLIAISDLGTVAPKQLSLSETAAELKVTERLLKIRLTDLKGEAWPDTLKIAG